MNSVAHASSEGDALKPAVFVYVEDYRESVIPEMTATNVGSYHGGNLRDELATLLSLAVGIRAQAGAITRDFSLFDGSYPKGRPIAYLGFGTPVLTKHAHQQVLPGAIGPHEVLVRFEQKAYALVEPRFGAPEVESAPRSFGNR